MTTTEIRLLTLALHKDTGVDYLNEAAAMIRELASIHRVRVDPHQFRLEILYDRSTPGLLQNIHQALLVAGKQLTPMGRY
ncbi:MAG: hypothetical protein WCS70_08600 [Verrucomicrobiota bacterium]